MHPSEDRNLSAPRKKILVANDTQLPRGKKMIGNLKIHALNKDIPPQVNLSAKTIVTVSPLGQPHREFLLYDSFVG